MDIKFEKVSRFKDIDIPLPTRSTAASAGYDFTVAEDIVLPPYEFFSAKVRDAVMERDKTNDFFGFTHPFTLDTIAALNKELKTKIPLVSTGMKCKMPEDVYLQLSVRSSTPLKHWIIMGNSVGIIDSDYWNNKDNEGEIFFQLINLAPFAIRLKRGDKIGQGIFYHYLTTESDNATGTRVGGFGSTDTPQATPNPVWVVNPISQPFYIDPPYTVGDWPPGPQITCNTTGPDSQVSYNTTDG